MTRKKTHYYWTGRWETDGVVEVEKTQSSENTYTWNKPGETYDVTLFPASSAIWTNHQDACADVVRRAAIKLERLQLHAVKLTTIIVANSAER